MKGCGFMKTHRISVKDMVTFLYAVGDLASQTKLRTAQEIGRKIHDERQNTYGIHDQKEVHVKTEYPYKDYLLSITGYIDGLLQRENSIIIEEIKSTSTDLSLINEKTYPAHLMQAKVYAYIYALNNNLKSITVWLTYIHIETKAVKTIPKRFNFSQLKNTMEEAVSDYLEWITLYEKHQFEKAQSIEGLTFPFKEYREGQYHFMGAIYQNLVRESILYATAPTGIGKTIGALFSGLKAINNPKQKLFYLTAKNAGKTLPVETVELLKKHGLNVKAITLNSKENMCLMDEVDCDPDICPYAKGFYNRLKAGLEDIFVHEDVYGPELIKQYGEYHKICPHEFALEISNYSDIIICDYNYVFDPRIRLIRYFEEEYYQPKLLIDEAHNLVDRSRSMYSSELSLDVIETLIKEAKSIKPSPLSALNALKKHMENALIEEDVEKIQLAVFEDIDVTLLNRIHHAMKKLDDIIQTQKKHPKRKAILEGYFQLAQFMRISEYFTKAFRYTIEIKDHQPIFSIVCFDASTPIQETIQKKTKGTILFSATLQPIEYYSHLLTKGDGKYFEVPSPFDPKRLGLFVDVSTSTKYNDRQFSINRIIDTIYAMLESKKGNYIVFFPSYHYMHMVYEMFDHTGYSVMLQDREMTMFERNIFIERFKSQDENAKILFSVLGGSFSEGIDYIGESLSGVLVVGVALPAFHKLNELLKDYYYQEGFNGFDYAYTYPGMNKVIQAVGRVIRTQEDLGIAILLDTRYNAKKYRSLMPSHWQPHWLEEEDLMQNKLETFWKNVQTKN